LEEATMYGVVIAANILRDVDVFLIRMKLMAEALQKVAGSRLTGLLETIAGNRYSGTSHD